MQCCLVSKFVMTNWSVVNLQQKVRNLSSYSAVVSLSNNCYRLYVTHCVEKWMYLTMIRPSILETMLKDIHRFLQSV